MDRAKRFSSRESERAGRWIKGASEWKMDAEKLCCDGCKSARTPFNCEAKQCAVTRNLPTCARCDDFPTCDKEIWTKWPPLKEKVETMRAKLRLS